jgi:hypothetical protein
LFYHQVNAVMMKSMDKVRADAFEAELANKAGTGGEPTVTVPSANEPLLPVEAMNHPLDTFPLPIGTTVIEADHVEELLEPGQVTEECAVPSGPYRPLTGTTAADGLPALSVAVKPVGALLAKAPLGITASNVLKAPTLTAPAVSVAGCVGLGPVLSRGSTRVKMPNIGTPSESTRMRGSTGS